MKCACRAFRIKTLLGLGAPSHPDPDVLATVDVEQFVNRKHPFAAFIGARVVVLFLLRLGRVVPPDRQIAPGVCGV